MCSRGAGVHGDLGSRVTRCTMSCAGADWIKEYVAMAQEKLGERFRMQIKNRRVQYTFGNGLKEVSTKTYTLPVGLGEKLPLGTLELCELEGGAPPLLSKEAHRQLGLVVDFGDASSSPHGMSEPSMKKDHEFFALYRL